jgi:hypothetical protein
MEHRSLKISGCQLFVLILLKTGFHWVRREKAGAEIDVR